MMNILGMSRNAHSTYMFSGVSAHYFLSLSLLVKVAKTIYHFVCVQIVLLDLLSSRTLFLGVAQSSEKGKGEWRGRGCLLARVTATLPLNHTPLPLSLIVVTKESFGEK